VPKNGRAPPSGHATIGHNPTARRGIRLRELMVQVFSLATLKLDDQ